MGIDRRTFVAGAGMADAGLLAGCSDGSRKEARAVSDPTTTTAGTAPTTTTPRSDPSTTTAGSGGERRRPNILFIYADQHRADVMGAAGNQLIATPNLDRLAAEGLRCTQVWTESPICQSARASLLSATYPSRHGVLGNFAGDSSPEWDTFPKALQQAGYTTATIGKTHYSEWPVERMNDSGELDVSAGGPPTAEWIASFGFDHVVEEFDKYVHTGPFETPYTRFLADRGMLEPYQAAVRAHFRATPQHWEGFTSPLPQELDLTSFLAAEALTWIGQQGGEKPWFLQLSFVQPHVPLMGDPVWAEHYANVDIPRTAPAIPSSTHPDWSVHLAAMRTHSTSELLTDEFLLAGARQYYAMVSLIDQKVGELLASLEASGQLDDTMVIYASDHGEMLGDHGLMAKLCFYKSSVRVPLIVRPPGGMDPLVFDGPVQAFDIAATMLDAAGTRLDDTPARSLLPVLAGADSHRDGAASMIRLVPIFPTWVGVTNGAWRATFDNDSGDLVELFDLEADPDEAINLWEAGPDNVVSDLREQARQAAEA